jgi:hypothetical protein
MKCEWGQAGNCLYLYGKRVVGKSGPGQSDVRVGVRVVGGKKACGHGGSAFNTQTPGKYPEDNLSLQHGESLKTRMFFMFVFTFTAADVGL